MADEGKRTLTMACNRMKMKSLGIPDAVESLHVFAIRAATSDLPNSRKRSRSPRKDQASDSGEDKASDSGEDQASGDYPSVEAGLEYMFGRSPHKQLNDQRILGLRKAANRATKEQFEKFAQDPQTCKSTCRASRLRRDYALAKTRASKSAVLAQYALTSWPWATSDHANSSAPVPLAAPAPHSRDAPTRHPAGGPGGPGGRWERTPRRLRNDPGFQPLATDMVCDYHPNSTGHRTVDCSKNPTRSKSTATNSKQVNYAWATSDLPDQANSSAPAPPSRDAPTRHPPGTRHPPRVWACTPAPARRAPAKSC
jgi:hypothetical protein